MPDTSSILMDLFDEHRVDYVTDHKNVRSGWIGLECPWCGPTDYYLGVQPDDLRANCWRCGPKRMGDVIAKTLNVPIGEALRLMRELGLRPGEGGITNNFSGLTSAGKYKPPHNVAPMSKAHRRYVRSRGLDPDELERVWNVQGIGNGGLWAWSLFIPATLRGSPVSWITRRIVDDGGPRYRAADPDREKYPLKSFLFGEDLCRNAVVIHEGPLDAFRTGPGATATCGTGFTDEQVARIVRFPVRVVCFDNEPDAQERASRLLDRIEPFPGESYRVELDSHDAASASDREIRRLRRFLR